MKILDPGTEFLSNTDVLRWITAKRAQHKTEDDAAALDPKAPKQLRPANFLKTLAKHERELTSSKYPHSLNPTFYTQSNYAQLKALDAKLDEVILAPLEEDLLARGLGRLELGKTAQVEMEMKSLMETEVLMVLNLAPTVVEMLQPLLEGWEERFTPEEMERVLGAVQEVVRCDEFAKNEGGEAQAEVGAEAA